MQFEGLHAFKDLKVHSGGTGGGSSILIPQEQKENAALLAST